MALSRVEQLRTVSIPDLVMHIFRNEVTYIDMSHHEDLRNYVVKVDDNYVLKVYGDRERWKGEVENLIRIHPCEFSTPNLIDYGMVNLHNGWVLTNLLPGTIMEDEYYKLSLKEKEDTWHRLGELLYQFHAMNTVSYSDVIKYNVNPSYSSAKYWNCIIAEYTNQKKRIVNNDFYGSKDKYLHAFTQIEDWFSEQEEKYRLPLVLCHNDFCKRNILCQTHSFGLLDFEMGHYAPRESDFARLAMDLKQDHLFESFLYGYYYNQNYTIARNNKTIKMYILIKTVEICSWAYHRAPDYYQYAFDMFKFADIM